MGLAAGCAGGRILPRTRRRGRTSGLCAPSAGNVRAARATGQRCGSLRSTRVLRPVALPFWCSPANLQGRAAAFFCSQALTTFIMCRCMRGATPQEVSMPHMLEWSRAYAHRLAADAAALPRRALLKCPEAQARAGSWRVAFSFPAIPLQAGSGNGPTYPAHQGLPTYAGAWHWRFGPWGPRHAAGLVPGQDGPNHRGPCLWIADNVCAERFEALLGKLTPAETGCVHQ